MKISGFKTSFKRNPAQFLLLGLLAFLPFLDGGTNLGAEYLLFFSPLPLFILSFLKSRKDPRLSLLPVLFFLSLSLLTLSLPGSISLAISIPAFFKMTSIFLLFITALLLFNTTEDLGRMIKTVLVVAFILSLLSLHLLLPWVEKPISPLNLVYANFGHNHLADYLVFALPASLALFLAEKQRGKSRLFGLMTLFFFTLLLTTFSRASLLFLPLITLTALTWFKPTPNLKKAVAGTLIFVPLGLLLLITAYSVSPPGLKARLEPQGWLIRQLIKPPFQEKRFVYWQEAATTMSRHPFTGSGLGTFKLDALRFQPLPDSWSAFAHNFLLDIGAEAGLLALAAVVAFLGVGLAQAYSVVKKQKRNPVVFGAFLGAAFSFGQALLDWNWRLPAIFLTFLVILAALAGQAKEKPLVPQISPRLFWGLMFVLAMAVFLFGTGRAAAQFFAAQGYLPLAVKLYPWDEQNYRDFLGQLAWENPGQFASEAARFLRLNHEESSAHRFLGEAYKALGQEEPARHHFELAAFYNPLEDPSLYLEIADLYQKQGQVGQAKLILLEFDRRAEQVKAKVGPEADRKLGGEIRYQFRQGASEIYYRLAQIHFAEKDFGQAFAFLAQALRFDAWVLSHQAPLPVLESAKADLVQLALTLAGVEEKFMLMAKRYYAKVFYLAGLEFLLREEFDQAASFWQKTVRLTPEWSQFWRELGGLYLFLGDFEKAGEVFAQCLETASGDPGCASGVKHAGWQKNWPQQPGHLQGEILALPD